MSYAGDLTWVNDYVGVPYLVNGRDRNGWDCWGLVLAVYRERLGLELPDWQRDEPFGIAQQIRAFGKAWNEVKEGALATEIDAPEPFAIALVLRHFSPHHVGVVVGGGILHCAAPYGGTVYDPMARFLLRYPAPSWWQWQR